MKVSVERDTALRGYWVKGLDKINQVARKALLCWDGESIFIPDNVVRELKHPDCPSLKVKEEDSHITMTLTPTPVKINFHDHRVDSFNCAACKAAATYMSATVDRWKPEETVLKRQLS